MRMSQAQMSARFQAADPDCDGLFFAGVLTTGIYCLPSCRARKPKPEHVRFFPSCETARAAGLRPCRKCHPDDFARGADPVLESIEALVGEIRSAPESFPGIPAVVRRSGFGATRLFELFRRHYHATPADLLLRARIEAVKRGLLAGDAPLAGLAAGAGFESLSVLHEHFRRWNGLTPAAYRGLRSARSFSLALPPGYALDHLRRRLGRDPQSLTERLEGDVFTVAVRRSAGEPLVLALALAPEAVSVEVESGPAPEAHAVAVGLLGLEQEAAAFVRLARRRGLGRLVAGRAGLTLPQTPSVFDGLLGSILGQQIRFDFACRLKRRLVERAGTRLAENLYAPPLPGAVARLGPDDLAPLQISRAKAACLIGVARLAEEGALDLSDLRHRSATRVERTLLRIRGLGPWSVAYLMMRSLGFADCAPLGDTGLAGGLRQLFRLEERPDPGATRRLMAAFSPHRSLATAHLWELNRTAA